jgi:hypothetical protein
LRTFTHKELIFADLHVDAKYEGWRSGNAGDDPLPALLGVSNQGGFRYLGSKEHPRLIVITTSLADPEWPDELDPETGIFTYFGDNKKPGRELHGTPRFGNLLLRNIFNATHTENRSKVPPILIFSSAGAWRDTIFRGLAVPGGAEISRLEDLVAVWKMSGTDRFQNYRAKFTILDIPVIRRCWLNDIQSGNYLLEKAPHPWSMWLQSGKYNPLRAVRTMEIRGKSEQLPSNAQDTETLIAIYNYFADFPYCFEQCAAELARLALGNIANLDLTRPSRDGGRDAIGQYQIGKGISSILVDFAIEAKCYATTNSVGVRELSRLISRLRHRQFGILVTTSWVHNQAFREIKEDRHPIIIISGADIVNILKANDINSPARVINWLTTTFPHSQHKTD